MIRSISKWVSGLAMCASMLLAAGAAIAKDDYYREEGTNGIWIYTAREMETNPSRRPEPVPAYLPLNKGKYFPVLQILADAQDSVVDQSVAGMVNALMLDATAVECKDAHTASQCRERRPRILARLNKTLGVWQQVISSEELLNTFLAVGQRALAEAVANGSAVAVVDGYDWRDGIRSDTRAYLEAQEWSVLRIKIAKAVRGVKLFALEVDASDAVAEIKAAFVDPTLRTLGPTTKLVNGRLYAPLTSRDTFLFNVDQALAESVRTDGFGLNDVTSMYAYKLDQPASARGFTLTGDREQPSLSALVLYKAQDPALDGHVFYGKRLPTYLSLAPHQVPTLLSEGLSSVLVLVDVPAHSAGRKLAGWRDKEGNVSVRAKIAGFALGDEGGAALQDVGLIGPGGDEFLPLVNVYRLVERLKADASAAGGKQ